MNIRYTHIYTLVIVRTMFTSPFLSVRENRNSFPSDVAAESTLAVVQRCI